jgi:hypothetical protein
MMRTLYVAPMTREARACGAAPCGAGPRAAEHIERALASGARDATSAGAIVLAGVCGGLDPSLAPGAVIVARRVTDAGGHGIDVEPHLLDAARAHLRAAGITFVSAALLTVDAPLMGADARRDAWNAHGAAGIDMETYGVAQAALRHRIPWIAVRVVLDPAGASLPPSLDNWRDESDERDIIRAALRRPREWPAYVRLALQSRAAMRALARSAPRVRDAVAPIQAQSAPASHIVEPIALV